MSIFEIAIIIILSILLCVSISIIIITRFSLKKTTEELKKLKNEDTNLLLSPINSMKQQNKLIEEINELLIQLRQERRNYIRKKHDLDMMITNISHDLRTPLTSAKGYLQLIEDGLSPEETQNSIQIIQKRLDRLNELIDSFFEFSKIISNGKQIEFVNTDIIALIEEAMAHYYDDFISQQRAIEFNCNCRPMNLKSNPQMLLRIFDNLIGNAYKHGIGTLEINAIQSENKIEIAFINSTNSKISDIEQLFEEFYTLDISRTTGNTGLGLAIAKQFTQMLDGEIMAVTDDDRFEIVVEMK